MVTDETIGEEDPLLAKLEVEAHVAIVENLQTVIGEGRAYDVATQPFAAVLIVAGDPRGTLQG